SSGRVDRRQSGCPRNTASAPRKFASAATGIWSSSSLPRITGNGSMPWSANSTQTPHRPPWKHPNRSNVLHSIDSSTDSRLLALRYLLDTNAVIALLNGRSALLARRLRRVHPAEVGVSSIVLHELFYGAQKSS